MKKILLVLLSTLLLVVIISGCVEQNNCYDQRQSCEWQCSAGTSEVGKMACEVACEIQYEECTNTTVKESDTSIDEDTDIHIEASQTGNYSLCAEISSIYLRTSCYYEIATETKDISICDNISGEETTRTTDVCIIVVRRDIGGCGNFDDLKNKRICYIDIAVLENNPSICDNIESSIVVNNCKDLVRMENV